MTTISTHDGIVNAFGLGKRDNLRYNKLTSNGATSAAGRWHELLTATGSPGPVTFSGTAGVATAMNASTAGALGPLANVSTETRYLVKAYAQSPTATLVPATMILCDFLLYYPSCVVTGTPTTLNNATTIPRYTTGAGVQAAIFCQTAYGAASPALTLTYTDQAGNTGNLSPAALTAPATSIPISTAHLRGTVGSLEMPFIAGDTGCRKIESYTLASGTTGTAVFVLYRPLVEIPVGAINTATLMNLVQELPAMETVVDDACLGFIFSAGGSMVTTASVLGSITTVNG